MLPSSNIIDLQELFGLVGKGKILTLPNHAELDTGTCKAIMRQASRYLSQEELYPHFYTE